MNMKTEQQRIAIAEACGWKREKRRMYGGEKNVTGWGRNAHLHEGDKDREFHTSPTWFPDYLNDLSAMHEAEKVLTDEQQHEYVRLLSSRHLSREGYWIAETSFAIATATAQQRAEAFLRCLNLWEDSPRHAQRTPRLPCRPCA